MTLKDIEVRAAEIREAMTAEDADIQALTEETRSLIEEKSRLIAETAEKEAEVEERKAEMEAVIEQRCEVIEKQPIEEKKTMAEIRDSKEYIDAYAEYIKTGDDKECRALMTDVNSGTVATPLLVYDIIKTAWDKEGLMSRVKKAYLKGTLQVGFEISGDDAVVHIEGDTAPNEEDLTLGIAVLTPISIKKWITITDEVYDLAGEEFLRYIYEEIAYRIAKKCADGLIASIEACGTTASVSKPSVPEIAVSSASLGTIASAMALLSDEADNPCVVMNKATWGVFKGLQANGNYGYDPFEGLDVVFNNSIKAYSVATSGETYAIVGDFEQGALANFPKGEEVTLKFDDLSLAESDLIKIVGREYVGLGPVACDAFVKITK